VEQRSIPSWWISTHLKNISQIGSSPQVGVKIKNIGNSHPNTCYVYYKELCKRDKFIGHVSCQEDSWIVDSSEVKTTKCNNDLNLVGGFNPFEQIWSSNWIISPGKGNKLQMFQFTT